MNCKYDKVSDSLYFSLLKSKVSRTQEVSDQVIIDYSSENTVVGIEILDAKNFIAHQGHSIPLEIISA